MLGLDSYSTEWKRTETGVHIPISLIPNGGFEWIILKTEPTIASKVSDEVQSFFLLEGSIAKHIQILFFRLFLKTG